jgi:hypothetical protein
LAVGFHSYLLICSASNHFWDKSVNIILAEPSSQMFGLSSCPPSLDWSRLMHSERDQNGSRLQQATRELSSGLNAGSAARLLAT